jgi:hypothetical protein
MEDLKKVVAYTLNTGLDYLKYKSIPYKMRVDKITSPGTRVLCASFPDFYKVYFLRWHDCGEPGYAHGGVDVWVANEERKSCYYYDSVAIHPSNESIKVREYRDDDGNVTGVSIAEYVPITKNDEKESRKLKRREKKLEKEAKKQARLDKRKEKERLKDERRQKKLKRMRDIEERLARKESVKKNIEKKLSEFVIPSKTTKKKKIVKTKKTVKINKKTKKIKPQKKKKKK